MKLKSAFILVVMLVFSSVSVSAQTAEEKKQRAEKAKELAEKRATAAKILAKITPPPKRYKPRRLLNKNMPVFKNLSFLDYKPLNYGVYLGVGISTYNIYPQSSTFEKGNVTTSYSLEYRAGIMANVRLSRSFSALIEPGIIYTDRELSFAVRQDENREADQTTLDKFGRLRNIVSTYAILPINLVYRSNRINNLRPFLKFGVSYWRNLSSIEGDGGKGNITTKEFPVAASGFSVNLGLGIDYYGEFVKFSPQIGATFGLTDELVDDASVYTSTTKSLYTKAVFIQLTIEQGE